jgi:hypothetical protein
LRSQYRNKILLITLVLIFMVLVLWSSYQIVVEYPGGDTFIGIWTGMRAFLSEGLSPYNSQIQTRVMTFTGDWGQPALPSRSQFNYPFYILLPVLPVAMIAEYTLARTLWMSLSILVVVLLVLAATHLTGWQPKVLSILAVILFALINPYTVTAVISGDFAVFSTLLVAVAILGIKNELDELAGLSLALSTISIPQVLVLVAFVTVWAISNRRDRIVLWTYGGVGLLITGAWLAHREWIIGYFQVLGEYHRLEGIFTPGGAFQDGGRASARKWAGS